jgi:flagellar motor switch protein FliN/FliY
MNVIKAQRAPQEEDKPDLQRILGIRLVVSVILAEKMMKLHDVLNLREGNVIEFKKPWNEKIDLVINNKKIASGVAVKIGEKFGFQITEIASPSGKAKALGEKN